MIEKKTLHGLLDRKVLSVTQLCLSLTNDLAYGSTILEKNHENKLHFFPKIGLF
jgi:hypothetical protein